jgi:hypothetical protein
VDNRGPRFASVLWTLAWVEGGPRDTADTTGSKLGKYHFMLFLDILLRTGA